MGENPRLQANTSASCEVCHTEKVYIVYTIQSITQYFVQSIGAEYYTVILLKGVQNYIDIISGNVSPDHVHMLISSSPHLSLSKSVQYIKWKSSRKFQCEFKELKKRYWRQHLWVLRCAICTKKHKRSANTYSGTRRLP